MSMARILEYVDVANIVICGIMFSFITQYQLHLKNGNSGGAVWGISILPATTPVFSTGYQIMPS
jgi:hypothetical protein